MGREKLSTSRALLLPHYVTIQLQGRERSSQRPGTICSLIIYLFEDVLNRGGDLVSSDVRQTSVCRELPQSAQPKTRDKLKTSHKGLGISLYKRLGEVASNIEIGSVTGTGQRLVEVDMIRLSLINTPLQRGDLRSADLRTVSTVSRSPQSGKTVETVPTDR